MSVYIIYQLKPIIVDHVPNGWINYSPIFVVSSIENGIKKINNTNTFVGTFDELTSELKFIENKLVKKRVDKTYLPYEYFLCTSALIMDNAFPQLNHLHQTILTISQTN
jgi:hypothetical protein